MRIGRTHVTVVTPAEVTTAWGLGWSSLDEADGATKRKVRSCNVQPNNVEVTLGGVTVELVGANVYAPAGSDITDTHALEIDGAAYAVKGPPQKWGTRSGRGRFLRFDIIPWDRLAPFLRHEISVERHTGNGPTGPLLEAATPVMGLVIQGAKTVRTALGEQALADATIYFPAQTKPIPAGSFLTPPAAIGGQRARVITSNIVTGGDLERIDHLEVTLAVPLAQLRTQAEAGLVERCDIERETTAWNPATKKSETTWESVHANVPCVFGEPQVSARTMLTGEAVTLGSPVVTIPADLAGIEPDDRVTVAGIGVVWVTQAPTSTEQVVRLLECRWIK